MRSLRTCISRSLRRVEAPKRNRSGVIQSGPSVSYLTVLYETLGPDWMTPDRFRFGASTLLNDLLMQVRKERTGRYSGGDYFTLD